MLKPDGNPASLQISGIAAEDGRLFLLTETHTSILVVDADSFEVLAVLGILPGAAADIAVRDQRAYVIIDHNYNEARPPLYVYDLP